MEVLHKLYGWHPGWAGRRKKQQKVHLFPKVNETQVPQRRRWRLEMPRQLCTGMSEGGVSTSNVSVCECLENCINKGRFRPQQNEAER